MHPNQKWEPHHRAEMRHLLKVAHYSADKAAKIINHRFSLDITPDALRGVVQRDEERRRLDHIMSFQTGVRPVEMIPARIEITTAPEPKPFRIGGRWAINRNGVSLPALKCLGDL